MASPPNSDSLRSGTDLLMLHPTGSEDPQQMSLAVGLLEWLRQGLERFGLRGSLWPETAVGSEGRRRFILRSLPWRGQEIQRKLELVPTAEGVLHLNLSEDRAWTATVALEDRRGDLLTETRFPFDADGIYERLPQTLNSLLSATDRTSCPKDSSELFHTTDHLTALASLYALERLVAFRAGIGRDEPQRLFEPALQCLRRDAAHPVARECLLRIGQSMLEAERPEDQKATIEAYERWSQLAPVSPLPPFYLAMAHQRTGEQETVRGAFEEALRRDPLFAPALQEYAIWLGDRGFIEQGVTMLKSAFGRTHIDGSLMDQAGCLLANAGRLAEAEPLFRASIRVGGPTTAHANLARGLLAHRRDEEAIAVLSEAITEGPDTSQIAVLAEMAKGPGLTAAKARALLRGLASQEERDEAVLKELLAVILAQDGAEAAAPVAQRLLQVSDSQDSRRFAHYVLLSRKVPDLDARWDAAVKDAIEGDTAAAEQFFRDVLEHTPSFGRAQFLLAATLERLGRISEVLPHVEAAVASGEGDDPDVLDLLARARAETGDRTGAAQAHHRAATLAPQNPRILRNAAISLLRAGYEHEGTGLAGASLALQPDQPELVDLLHRAAEERQSRGAGFLGRLRYLLRRVRRAS